MNLHRTLLLPLLLWSTAANAQVQMVFKGEIGGQIEAELQVNGNDLDRRKIESVFQEALRQADHLRQRLDPKNPQSETARLLTSSAEARGPFSTSPELATLLDTAVKVAAVTRQKEWRSVRVDPISRDVTFKRPAEEIDLSPYLTGYLADQISADLKNAGFKNIFLKLGEIYTTTGRDFNGPWKIPVSDNRGGYANRALYYNVGNASAATLSGNGENLKSVTVFSSTSAATAQGLAHAVSHLDLKTAGRLLQSVGVPQAVLVDAAGEFHPIPTPKK